MTPSMVVPRNRLGVAVAGLLASLPAAAPVHAEPPLNPLVVSDMPSLGRRGGELRMLIGSARDTRLLTVYGHARLVNYTPDLQLYADILESYQVAEGRSFTLKLRTGHKWSDGQPFTAEDFRFWFEDVAGEPKLNPTGLPVRLLIDGRPPTVAYPDAQTVSISWDKPNPYFLPMLAAASPEPIFAPAHYLKAFHPRYAEPAALAKLVKDSKSRDWAQLFGRKERMNKVDNPDLPTLDPWHLVTAPPADRFIAERNPYFHRVDSQGQQLPYIDRIILQVVDNKLVPIKTGAGETDLQSRGLFFKDYTFLKESEPRSGLRTLLWREARGAHLALFPNLNATDPVWRTLFHDRRFREALALSVDRQAISEFLYFGLAAPSNNTILEDSPLYDPSLAAPCSAHDPARANALLDELGLKRRAGDGLRLLPDGRPLELTVETAGEDTEQTDLLELVRDGWAQVGFRIHTKPSEREVFRNRAFAGESLMTVWYGIENGAPNADTSPEAFAPTNQYDQLQWPRWGQWFETRGQAGEAPTLPAAQHLAELNAKWGRSANTAERQQIWAEMLQSYAKECFTIGTVSGVLQPVAARRELRNLPEKALYSWEPQGQLGVYRPDTFWLDR